jgi:hypothetical protein
VVTVLKQIGNRYDRSAVSGLSEVAGRHFVADAEKGAWGFSRDGVQYSGTFERYTFDRALNGGVALSSRRELLKSRGAEAGGEREFVGSREWRFVYDPCGTLQLVSCTVSSPAGESQITRATEYKEWVGGEVSWIHRIRASSLCNKILGLYRQEANTIDPLRGLNLPSRHLR